MSAIREKGESVGSTAESPLLYRRLKAAEMLSMSASTFDRLTAAGVIPTVRLSPGTARYRRSDLLAAIDKAVTRPPNN